MWTNCYRFVQFCLNSRFCNDSEHYLAVVKSWLYFLHTHTSVHTHKMHKERSSLRVVTIGTKEEVYRMLGRRILVDTFHKNSVPSGPDMSLMDNQSGLCFQQDRSDLDYRPGQEVALCPVLLDRSNQHCKGRLVCPTHTDHNSSQVGKAGSRRRFWHL